MLIGVAGAGKTTAGQALGAELGWRFVDGDDHHTPQAIAGMRAGIPLTDADREPWLAVLHRLIAAALERREHLVIACSAIKARYRAILRGDCRRVRFVFLDTDAETLTRRLAGRTGHFAGPALVASQLADLEPPGDDVLTLDATRPTAANVAQIRREFGV